MNNNKKIFFLINQDFLQYLCRNKVLSFFAKKRLSIVTKSSCNMIERRNLESS